MPEIDPEVWREIGASLLLNEEYLSDDESYVHVKQDNFNFKKDTNPECLGMDEDWTYL